jgi:myo-inositol-1(or 4)-monophosphatase
VTSRQARGAKNTSQANVGADALLEAAIAAAEAAADVIERGANDGAALTWEVKGHADFVSAVDRAAEETIRGILLEEFPDARIVGEELSPALDVRDIEGLAFVVDPLDGTTNFLHGYPEYAVSIAAVVSGDPVVGVVINVPAGERFTAVRGEGAWRDDDRLRVSPITDPSRALIGTGFPFRNRDLVPRYARQFERVMRTTSGIRRAGSAALDLCDVACGRFEGFWELHLSAWDVAAGILMVREAGGIVTDLAGQDAPVAAGPIVAGSPAMHAWLLETINAD